MLDTALFKIQNTLKVNTLIHILYMSNKDAEIGKKQQL